jgi:MFS family permease
VVRVIFLSWALLLGVALIMLGNGLQTSLLGLRATDEGFATGATGLVMSAFYVGFLAGSRLTPRIVRDVGHIRVFAAWASMASVAILLHGLWVHPVPWTLFRFLTGFCYAGLYVVAESWLNDRADNDSRGQLLSTYMVVQYLGLAGGQLLLNLAAPAELVLFVLTSALISLSLVPISLTTSAIQPANDHESLPLRRLFRLSPLGVITCAGAGLSTGALLGMGAVYAESIDLSVGQISLFMAALILGAASFQFPLGRLSDRIDRRRVILALNLVAVCRVCLAFFGMGRGMGTTMALIYCVGGVTMPVYALGVAFTNDDLRPSQMVAASSSLVLVFGLGASLGPLTVATTMSLFGPGGFFLAIASMHGAIALFALLQIARRTPRIPEDQDDYLPVPASSTLAWRQQQSP